LEGSAVNRVEFAAAASYPAPQPLWQLKATPTISCSPAAVDFTLVAIGAACISYNLCKAGYHGGHQDADPKGTYPAGKDDYSVTELASIRLAVVA
jgi:hypothetical protein